MIKDEDGPVASVRAKWRRPADDSFGAFRDLLLTLHRLSNALADADAFKNHELSISEWVVLDMLEEQGPIKVRDLVRHTGVSRQRVRKVLTELESKRMVEVRQFDEGDRRKRLVRATPKAKTAYEKVRKDLEEILSSMRRDKSGAKTAARLAIRLDGASRLSKQLLRSLGRGHRDESPLSA
jgi:DNA-binding MarR family transcriptional regulator